MYDEERDEFDNEEIREKVNRFRKSLISGRKKYFDVSEFEGIVEHLLEEGDLKTSEIAAIQGMQIHPGATPLQLKYAQVLLNKGKYEEALRYISVIEKIEDNNADIHLIKGSAFLVMGHEQKALKSFGKAIRLAEGDLDEIYYHIGSSYIHIGNIHKAIHYFEKTLEANPENDMALGELGFFCEQVGDFEKSVKYYNQYLDLDPYNYFTWFNLGITLNLAGKFEEAIKAYEYALLLNSGFHQSIFNMANAYANLGKYSEAIKKYREYLIFFPENDDAFCYIGECYLNLENYVKSEQWYHKALKINVENDSAWFGLALLRWIESDYINAIFLVQKALKFDSKVSEYWITLAKIYKDMFKRHEALKAVKKAAKLEPDNPETWLTWVEIELKFGELQNAFAILSSAMVKNDDALLKYRMVGLLLEIDREPEAIELLKIALAQGTEPFEFLYDFYPAAKKNRKILKVIGDFKKLSFPPK